MTDLHRRRLLWGGGLLALVLALPSCARKEEGFQGTDITGVDWGRDFHLIDHAGRPRTLADFRDKAVLLFFGYTHCPDACPTTMAKMARAVELLGEDGQRVQGLGDVLRPSGDAPADAAPARRANHAGRRRDRRDRQDVECLRPERRLKRRQVATDADRHRRLAARKRRITLVPVLLERGERNRAAVLLGLDQQLPCRNGR